MELEYSNKRCPPNKINALTFRTTEYSGDGKWRWRKATERPRVCTHEEGGLTNVYLVDSETFYNDSSAFGQLSDEEKIG